MFAVLEKLTLLSHVPIQNNNNRTYRMLQDYYFPTGTITLPCPYNNNLARPERQHYYYLDAWNETFVWLGFIIIISAFSGKIIIWTLEYQTFLWSRNHVTYFHFGIPTCEKWRGRLFKRYVYLFVRTLKYEYTYDKTMLEKVFSIACSFHCDKVK